MWDWTVWAGMSSTELVLEVWWWRLNMLEGLMPRWLCEVVQEIAVSTGWGLGCHRA